jgi:OHCU decarboxylase
MPAVTQARISLTALNVLSREEFTRLLGGVIEHSPHFAERAAAARPCASLDDLHHAFLTEIERAPHAEQLALLCAHPDLADRLVQLTASSTHEQSSAGLDALTGVEFADFQRLNTTYRERFGFPFIICARLNSKDTILAAFRTRLDHPPAVEFKTALAEVAKIARLRLADLIA